MKINRILIDVNPINSNLFKYSNYLNEVLIYVKIYHTIFEDQSFLTMSRRDWTVC